MNNYALKECKDCRHFYGVSLCKQQEKPMIAAWQRLKDCGKNAKYFQETEHKLSNTSKAVLEFKTYLY